MVQAAQVQVSYQHRRLHSEGRSEGWREARWQAGRAPGSSLDLFVVLVERRGLGPGPWFPVSQLSERRLAAGIDAGLRGLERFTARAEQVACEMAREDGVARVADLLEGLLPAWWQDRGASRHSC